MKGAKPPARNRFRDLDPDVNLSDNPTSLNKRNRTNDFVPLPETRQNDDHFPRYLVATAVGPVVEEKIKPLSSYNVFQIEKGLRFISPEYTEVTELKSGDLLIKALNLKAAEKLMKATYIDLVPVKITSHRLLNSTQGRIYSRNIINLSEKELIEGLTQEKVIEIRKLSKKVDGKTIYTGAAIVTFDLIRRPEKMKLGWERVKVQEYIPNPMRCKNCQKLGHTKNTCKNIEVCHQCAIPVPHKECTRIFCINCNSETHRSDDSTCPSFLKHKSVNKIKLENRCTTREAWKTYNSNPTMYQIEPFNKSTNKPTLSQIVKNTIPTTETNQSTKERENNYSKLTSVYTNKSYTNENNNSKEIQQHTTTTKNNNYNNKAITTKEKNNIPEEANKTLTSTHEKYNPINTSNDVARYSYTGLFNKFPELEVTLSPNTSKNPSNAQTNKH